MPVARRATPPTSQIREQLSVLNSLSAWTDTGEEEKPKEKGGYQRLVGGPEQDSWKEHVKEWLDPEGDHFNMVIGLVIIGNAVTIGFETEYGADSIGFSFLENFFNVIFLSEMCLRLRLLRCQYFLEPWNVFDFTLVTIGTLDLWVLPVLTSSNSALQHVTVLRSLRMMRLMRVLRVIRLFRMFQQLFLIMQAFGKAFQIVLLMGLLVLILDYVCAIIVTQGIGHQADLWEGIEDHEKINKWFGTIPASMQTLFMVMTLTGWDDISYTLVKVLPPAVVYPALVLYIMVTSYTMLSLITGIISESLITAQQEYRLRKDRIVEEKKKEVSFELRNFLLNEALDGEDKDKYNNADVEALKSFMKGDTDTLMKLASLNIHMTEQGLLALIDKMADGNGKINVDYFVDKLTNLVGGATASSIMDLKFDIAKLNSQLDTVMGSLGITADGKKTTAAAANTKHEAPAATTVNVMSSRASGSNTNKSPKKAGFA